MTFLRRLWPYLLLVCTLVATVLIVWHRDYLRDQWVLRDYQPVPAIADLAENTAMTAYAERLFLVNKPELNNKETFNRNCHGLSEEVAVLGCYRGNRNGIYVYNITDPRLAGVEEVTAAHEMLHQAFDRLTRGERERVTKLLQDFVQDGLQDQSVKDKIAIYQQAEADHMATELHSIIGTEVADLPAELEQYYAQYFMDRSKVVAYRQQSQAAFDAYRQQINEYDTRLTQIKPQIEANEADLTVRQQQLRDKKAAMDADLATGKAATYNAAVPEYNRLVRDYNAKLASAKALIEEYNRIVAERNIIAVQVKGLNEALDSRLETH